MARKAKIQRKARLPRFVKEEVLRKQNNRGAHYNRLLNVVDWGHKDDNRSKNKESNCQTLCPNCHAIKLVAEESRRY